MQVKLASYLLVVISSLIAFSSIASACGGYGGFRPFLVTEGEFEGSIVRGNQLIAIDPDGSLISTDLDWGTVRNYGRFGRNLLPHLDVQGDRACVATDSEICEISLKTGKLVRTHQHSQGKCGAVIVGDHKVFLNNGTSVAIMDMTNGATLRKINLMSHATKLDSISTQQAPIQHARAGDRLYIIRPNTRGVAVVDLKSGRRNKDIYHSMQLVPESLYFSEDTLYVIGASQANGIRSENLTIITAATGKTKTSFPLSDCCQNPPAQLVSSPTEIIGSFDGGVLVSFEEKTLFFSKKGALVE